MVKKIDRKAEKDKRHLRVRKKIWNSRMPKTMCL